ncbi:MAG: GTPase HflX [Angelakisella sp.]
MERNEQQATRETAVLAAVDTGEYDLEISLAELRELADSAEIDVLGVVTQKRGDPDPATAMGSGRVEELGELVRQTGAELIIFDCELSPAQLRNIEKICDCPVIDRTMLILNIFARRAVTAEGKLQVELAQLRYQLPRLAGKGVQLSRQGGGGTGGAGARRGAGESKLETDRRHIRRRIEALTQQMEEVTTRRERLRERRKKESVTTVAIVGYTNVGKSTLLNTLTQAGVLVQDKLFATLDPTSRALLLPDGRQIMLIDTVGLVRRLPHHLVEAFKSTLEEASTADLILNVCDITSNEMQEQLSVTLELLRELGAEHTPVVTVLNKCDQMTGLDAPLGINAVLISAKTGEGLDRLLLAVQNALPATHLRLRLHLPYSVGELEARLVANGKVFSREYTADGVELELSLDKTLLYLVEKYVVPVK